MSSLWANSALLHMSNKFFKEQFNNCIKRRNTYVGEQKSDSGLQGGNTVHKEILDLVPYYKRFDLQGGGVPPHRPPMTQHFFSS